MNFSVRVPLQASDEQIARLQALQQVFAQVCNELSPHVQQTRVWNRVTLHHLYYRDLREKFPGLGSQMVCNAIYAVSRMARLIYQHPHSPYCISRRPGLGLPLLRFADNCPVYFDRHTLSIRDDHLSMFTMDGRIRFELVMTKDQLRLFQTARLREVVLKRVSEKAYELVFRGESEDLQAEVLEGLPAVAEESEEMLPVQTANMPALPAYVSVEVDQ